MTNKCGLTNISMFLMFLIHSRISGVKGVENLTVIKVHQVNGDRFMSKGKIKRFTELVTMKNLNLHEVAAYINVCIHWP